MSLKFRFPQIFSKHKKRSFTLIELVIVIIIIGTLFGISAGSILRAAKGSAPRQSTMLLGGKLTVARSLALAQHDYIAVVIPTDHMEDDAGRVGILCKVSPSISNAADTTTTFKFESVIDSDAFFRLHAGTVAEVATGSQAIHKVNNVNVRVPGRAMRNVIMNDCDAIVFRPTGQLAGNSIGNIKLQVSEGTYSGNRIHYTNEDNFYVLSINYFTGKVEYEQ